jgi:PIN domain nuclease of toxin-antitoxin system
MAIKSSLERLKLPRPIDTFLEEQLPANRVELLAITIEDLKAYDVTRLW